VTYAFRTARESDAPALADLTLVAIRSIGSRSYSHDQIDAWASRHPGPKRFVESLAGGDTIIVAVNAEDIPVAYALVEKGNENGSRLDMLYCHPDHTRRGLADELLARAEAHARGEGDDRLFTEASELARPAFERAEYDVLHRRDFEIAGVAIHNYAMEKRLR